MARKATAEPKGKNDRVGIWDVVLTAVSDGWATTLRLCLIIVLLLSVLIAVAAINAPLVRVVSRFFGL